MSFRKGIVATLLIVVALFLSGCITPVPEPIPTPAPTDEQTPGAFNLPIPIPADRYLKPQSIVDTNFAPNTIPFNITYNSTASILTGTGLRQQIANGSITLNRTSALIVTVALDVKTAAGNNAYLQARLNDSTGAPAGSNGSVMLPGQRFFGQFTDYNSTTVIFYNKSVKAGTYSVELYGNSSSTGAINFGNVTVYTQSLPN